MLETEYMGFASDVSEILFQSFEIRGYILNNQKFLIGLDTCFRPSFFNPLGQFDTIQSLNRLPYQIMFISGFHHQIMSGSLMRLE